MTAPTPTQAELEAATALEQYLAEMMTVRYQIPTVQQLSMFLVAHRAEPIAESALQTACQKLIAYRDRAGALAFQLEKADDFINQMRMVLDGQPADSAESEEHKRADENYASYERVKALYSAVMSDPAQAHAAELEAILEECADAMDAVITAGGSAKRHLPEVAGKSSALLATLERERKEMTK